MCAPAEPEAPSAVPEILEPIFVHVRVPVPVRQVRSEHDPLVADAVPALPQAAELLEDASEDILTHMHFPREHRRRLHSTNPIERLRREVKRRTRVIGIFPTRDSLMRMVGILLAEQDDEWQVSDRRYFAIGSMAKVDVSKEVRIPRSCSLQSHETRGWPVMNLNHLTGRGRFVDPLSGRRSQQVPLEDCGLIFEDRTSALRAPKVVRGGLIHCGGYPP